MYVLPYHSIFLHTHFGKFGKCRLKPTQTATPSSISCRRHVPIWPKLERHVMSCRHVATCRRHFQLRGGESATSEIDGGTIITSIMAGGTYIIYMAGRWCQTGMSHLLSYLGSHQKKKQTSQHLIWDTKKCQKNVRRVWTVPFRKKREKQQINTHASRIRKSGTTL